MDKEVLIYCPKCSRQIVTEESRLCENMLCPYCGHTFVAKKPVPYSENKEQLKKLVKVLEWIIVCGVGLYCSEFFRKRCAPHESQVLSMLCKDADRVQQYGQTLRNSGVLDIYISKTGKELRGEINPNKYRQSIEMCLREATAFNLWCKEKKTSFDITSFEGESSKAGEMIRDVYDSYYELSTVGIKLFTKTLECHRICCGARMDADNDDVIAYKAFYERVKKRDAYGRQVKPSAVNVVSEIKVLCDIVDQLAQEYSDLEAEKLLLMQTTVNAVKNTMKN